MKTKHPSSDISQPEPVDLSPYISAISQRFRPAINPDEATHQFTTPEIKAAIKELNPGMEISDSLVFEAMQTSGFYFNAITGAQSLRFKWLLVEK
ncbi:hypothetical protein SDC9_188068 [bioreactor metagenome]|uniref:Uncharacterized protein n=1 Tax=bioreactor metagenome TaxID=1076179 RepID=A0A645HNX0_9ZZZZ